MCFANAVFQLLVHSPPFWNLFREVGDLKGQRGAGGPKTCGGPTPLVDATVRFFEEFMLKEKEQPSTQQATRGKPREDEEEGKQNKDVGPLEPTYMYDVMKEKMQLKKLLVRSHDQDAPLCY
jgi:ubiquitin carboxyl-terminal hydrolase 10